MGAPEVPQYNAIPNNDDMVVPMHNQAPINFNEIEDKPPEEQQEEEEMDDYSKAKFETMKEDISEDTLKLLFSKRWQSKELGLDALIAELPGSMQNNPVTA